MEILSATEAKANLLNLLEQVNQDHLPRMITSQNVSEEEFMRALDRLED